MFWADFQFGPQEETPDGYGRELAKILLRDSGSCNERRRYWLQVWPCSVFKVTEGREVGVGDGMVKACPKRADVVSLAETRGTFPEKQEMRINIKDSQNLNHNAVTRWLRVGGSK